MCVWVSVCAFKWNCILKERFVTFQIHFTYRKIYPFLACKAWYWKIIYLVVTICSHLHLCSHKISIPLCGPPNENELIWLLLVSWMKLWNKNKFNKCREQWLYYFCTENTHTHTHAGNFLEWFDHNWCEYLKYLVLHWKCLKKKNLNLAFYECNM